MEPYVVAIAWTLPYFTIAIFAGGVSFKAINWLVHPMGVKWALYPAPMSGAKRLTTVLVEVFTLRSLLRGDTRLWVGALLFHIGLFTSFALHTFVNLWFAPIYNTIFELCGLTPDTIATLAFLIGSAAGLLTAGAVVYPFLFDRLFVREVRDISSFADYAALVLLLGTIGLGTYLRLFQVIDPVYLKTYLVSLATFSPVPPPNDPLFLLHLLLAQIYLICFPFSKPMHFIGLLINQRITVTR